MKKTGLVVGLSIVSAVVAGGLLAYFKPDSLKRLPSLAGGSAAAEMKVEDFYLLDHQGKAHALHRQSANKAVVLISTANGCPVMKEAALSANKAVVLISTANGCPVMKEAAPKIKALRDQFSGQGVVFWLLDSNPQDNRAAIAQEAAQLGLDLPVLEDRIQLVASSLGIAQTCEAVAINTANWMTF